MQIIYFQFMFALSQSKVTFSKLSIVQSTGMPSVIMYNVHIHRMYG